MITIIVIVFIIMHLLSATI